MHIMCVVSKCEAEAEHIVSSSKQNAGYGTCTPHLRDVVRIVAGYHRGRITVSFLVPDRRVTSQEVKVLTSRRQHHLAG